MDCGYCIGCDFGGNTEVAIEDVGERGKIAVLGAGESGVGAALLARKMGIDVFVSDAGTIADRYREVLCQNDIRFEEGTHTTEEILSVSEVIKSPGIPDTAAIVKAAAEKGIPVISEIEYAGRHSKATMIGITGSNGKTTTSTLLYRLLKDGGLNVGLTGNVGKSLAWQIAEDDKEYYVVELSSFQLDGMFDFRCHMAVLLNITPDHLDRYDYDIRKYAASKFRILQNMTEADFFIYNADDVIISEERNKRNIKPKSYPVSIERKLNEGGFLESDHININLKGKQLRMSIYELGLQGRHNAFNSMAAAIVAKILDMRNENIRESMSDFQNIEHRLESVTKVHNIEFINDSKATNVNSTWYALESVEAPIIWIVGGVDKGNNYDALLSLVKQKVKAIICLGKDNKKIIAAFSDHVPEIIETKSMQEAVAQSYRMGYKGDNVLLSPACASFDLFENYEDRGNQFKTAVRSL